MVAVLGAGLPEGLLGGDRARSGDSVRGLGHRQPPVQGRNARAVREQVADPGPLLAARLELRPVRAHRRVQVQQPALLEQQRYGRGHALGRGADDLHGVLAPGLGALGVLGAGPQVHDLVPVAVDGHGRAPVAEHLEVAYERVPDGLEALRHHTLDVHGVCNNLRPALMPPLCSSHHCAHPTDVLIPPIRSAGRTRRAAPGGAPASAPRRTARPGCGRPPRWSPR